jgi:uncharacterized protein YneF (UPF0154 family)
MKGGLGRLDLIRRTNDGISNKIIKATGGNLIALLIVIAVLIALLVGVFVAMRMGWDQVQSVPFPVESKAPQEWRDMFLTPNPTMTEMPLGY